MHSRVTITRTVWQSLSWLENRACSEIAKNIHTCIYIDIYIRICRKHTTSRPIHSSSAHIRSERSRDAWHTERGGHDFRIIIARACPVSYVTRLQTVPLRYVRVLGEVESRGSVAFWHFARNADGEIERISGVHRWEITSEECCSVANTTRSLSRCVKMRLMSALELQRGGASLYILGWLVPIFLYICGDPQLLSRSMCFLEEVLSALDRVDMAERRCYRYCM